MRTKFLPLAVAVVALSTAAAFAAVTTGSIKTLDMKAMTLTLDNGSTYILPTGFKDPGLKVGEKVSVTWALVKGKNQVSAVTIVK